MHYIKVLNTKISRYKLHISFIFKAISEHILYFIFGKKVKDTHNIPIVINNFNRYEMLCKLINSLTVRGYHNIYILDNQSTYPPLLEYYKKCPYKVFKLDKNYGYLALWKNKSIFKMFRNGYYVYTDADMEIDSQCPNDFMDYFVSLLKKYPMAQKIGFGIRIDDLPDCFANKKKVIEWEKQFWENKLETGVYKAWVDTTFALYRPYAYGPTSERLTIRTGTPYLIKHLPWYINSQNLKEEEIYYTNKISQSTHWSQLNR